MSDSEVPPLPDDLKALIDSERKGLGEMPGPNRDRVWEIVERRLPLPISKGDPRRRAPPPSNAGTAPTGVQALVRIAVIAAPAFLVGLGVGAVVRPRVVTRVVTVTRTEPAPPPPSEPAEPPTPPTAVITAVDAGVMPPRQAPVVRAAPPATAPSDPGPGHDADLAAERVLVDTASTALSRGQAIAALMVLQRAGARFPHGQLLDEAESLRIRALVSLGRYDDARTRGAAFLQHYPDSLQRPAVEAALHTIP